MLKIWIFSVQCYTHANLLDMHSLVYLLYNVSQQLMFQVVQCSHP